MSGTPCMHNSLCIICESSNANARAYCTFFVNEGYNVDIIALAGYNQWTLPGARIHFLKKLPAPLSSISILNNFFYTYQCRRLVAKIRPDVLNAVFLFDCGYLAATTGFHPMVLTPLGSDVLLYPFQKKKWMRMAQQMTSSADAIISNSHIMSETLTEKLGVPISKIHSILWNGIDTRAFCKTDSTAAKKLLGLENKVVFFSARLLTEVYNIGRIVGMFALCKSEIPRAHLIIGADGPLRAAIERQSQHAGIADSITFTGRISVNEMPLYINACDLYLTVPRSDSCASSLLEAFACEKIVVASDIPANRAWIRHGENGWLVNPDNSESFARACIHAVQNPLSADALARNRSRIAEEADGAQNMSSVANLFSKLAVSHK